MVPSYSLVRALLKSHALEAYTVPYVNWYSTHTTENDWKAYVRRSKNMRQGDTLSSRNRISIASEKSAERKLIHAMAQLK